MDDPGIKVALEDAEQRAGDDDMGLVGVVRAERVTWPDASLGCPEAGKFYAQVLTPGVWLVLSHVGRQFDYSIGGPRAVHCDQERKQEPLDPEPIQGLWSTLAPIAQGGILCPAV